MKILIANDFGLLRHGLKSVLSGSFTAVTIGEAESAGSLLQLLGEQSWELLLCDAYMLREQGGSVLATIRERFPDLPVLITCLETQHYFVVEAIRAGIKGYLTKSDLADNKLPQAILKVIAGGRYISQDIAESLAAAINGESHARELREILSAREMAIMTMLSHGVAPKRIAYDLGLSIKTVSTYRGRALKKLNMQSNAEFFRFVIQNNLMP